jgi:hypothetical protein
MRRKTIPMSLTSFVVLEGEPSKAYNLASYRYHIGSEG